MHWNVENASNWSLDIRSEPLTSLSFTQQHDASSELVSAFWYGIKMEISTTQGKGSCLSFTRRTVMDR